MRPLVHKIFRGIGRYFFRAASFFTQIYTQSIVQTEFWTDVSFWPRPKPIVYHPYTVRIPIVYHPYTIRIPSVYHPYTTRIPPVYHHIPPVYHPYTAGIPPYTTVYRQKPAVYHRIPSVYQSYTIRKPAVYRQIPYYNNRIPKRILLVKQSLSCQISSSLSKTAPQKSDPRKSIYWWFKKRAVGFFWRTSWGQPLRGVNPCDVKIIPPNPQQLYEPMAPKLFMNLRPHKFYEPKAHKFYEPKAPYFFMNLRPHRFYEPKAP